MLGRMTQKYVTPLLGPTELDILNVLWAHGPQTIRQVHTAITHHRPIAYTTILTTSERMEEKGVLMRTAADWRYKETITNRGLAIRFRRKFQNRTCSTASCSQFSPRFALVSRLTPYGPTRLKKTLAGSEPCDWEKNATKSLPSDASPT